MKVFVDANPKQTCYVALPPKGNKITVIRELDKKHTSNEAEYLAVIVALEDMRGDLEISSDSLLVVNQLNHRWGIKEDRLRKLASRAWLLILRREDNKEATTLKWVPRNKNLAGKVLG